MVGTLRQIAPAVLGVRAAVHSNHSPSKFNSWGRSLLSAENCTLCCRGEFRRTSSVSPSGLCFPALRLFNALAKLVVSKPFVSNPVRFTSEFSQFLIGLCRTSAALPFLSPCSAQRFSKCSISRCSGVISILSSYLPYLTCQLGLRCGGALPTCSAGFSVFFPASRFRCLRLLQICLVSSLCLGIEIYFFFPFLQHSSTVSFTFCCLLPSSVEGSAVSLHGSLFPGLWVFSLHPAMTSLWSVAPNALVAGEWPCAPSLVLPHVLLSCSPLFSTPRSSSAKNSPPLSPSLLRSTKCVESSCDFTNRF